MSGERAIYYAKSVGKHRLYRSGYPVPDQNGLILFEFKDIEKAFRMCDDTNDIFNDDFKPIEIC